jgi:hypothetical protein
MIKRKIPVQPYQGRAMSIYNANLAFFGAGSGLNMVHLEDNP